MAAPPIAPADIRFAVDGMLHSLATWLRLLGYDCLGDPRQFGRALLEQAVTENRVFLTRNVHLHDRLPAPLLQRARITCVTAQHLPQQLREIVARFALDSDHFTFTRCVDCNVPLETVSRETARRRTPAEVAARERSFWTCPQCRRIFWQGSHVGNSRARLQRWLASADASC